MKYLSTLVLLFCFAPVALAATPDDPLIDEQWYLDKIQAKMAWDVVTGSSQITVAVLDSGVDPNHPDLAENMWINTEEKPNNGVDDDHNGFVDDVLGWDFVDHDNTPKPDTGSTADDEAVAHGSLVAGLIGAIGNNSRGVVGVTWDVMLMPLRALDDVGIGSSQQVADAIDYAVAMGADIINLSLSGTDSDGALRESVERAYDAGVLIVAALGNENQDTDIHEVYPACYGDGQEDWVIGVTASTQTDTKASFSNFGKSCADIAAPGVDIYGITYNDPTQGFDEFYDGGWSGTSMSSPLVAGASALILSAYPALEPEDVRVALQLSVDPLTGPLRDEMGAGRLNVARALEVAGQIAAAKEAAEEEPAPEVPAGLQEDDVFRSTSFPQVYLVTGSGGRRIFINENAYFTYEDSFDAISTITDDEAGSLTLEGLVLPRAGTVLVKIQSVPTVYALEADESRPYEPKLRAIASEDVARAMYGERWADYVIDVDPAFFPRFGHGEDINSPEPVDLSIMKTREELAQLSASYVK